MALTSSLVYPMSLLLCLVMAAGALATPPQPQQQREDQFMPTTGDVLSEDVDSVPYTEATPSHDFTLSNMSSTIEEILAEVGVLQDTDTRSKRTSCACSSTIGAYGGTQGTAFVDITTNHCGADITDIWVRFGDVIDSLQVRYKFSDGSYQTMPMRGGTGGGLTRVIVPQAGKIIGITGGITSYYGYSAVITQLRIVVLDSNNNVQIYGPYGTEVNNGASSFAVYGDIKSLFGYSGSLLNGFGVYYESWGACTSPCN